MNLESLAYPIGQYLKPESISQDDLDLYIDQIAKLPGRLENVVYQLNKEQLNTPYRPNGWTLRQVIHHLPDSHMNAYIRIKLALTEDSPTIKPYREKEWSNLGDVDLTSIETSLNLLSYLHHRWVILLKTLSKEDFQKSFIHPEQNRIFYVDESIAHYAWHGNHHLGHITSTIKRYNW